MHEQQRNGSGAHPDIFCFLRWQPGQLAAAFARQRHCYRHQVGGGGATTKSQETKPIFIGARRGASCLNTPKTFISNAFSRTQ